MISISMTDRSQTADARRRARAAAFDLGLGEAAAERAALIATEAATNLERHAISGEILLIPHPHPQFPTLDLVSIDHGPGIESLSTCLEDGFSTAGGAGHGLGSIQRQSDRFDIFSTPGKGTIVVATIGKPPQRDLYQIEGLCSPKPGEARSGDGWTSLALADATVLMVCDGLGHGPKAAKAARAAEQAFTAAGSTDLEATIHKLDEDLRPTRGAAVALAALPVTGASLEFLGVGNISGYLRSGSREQRTVSFEGVIGRGDFRVRRMSYEVEDPFLAVFATDGLATRWDLSHYRGLIGREPITIAAVLYRDFRRIRDDCTVVVARRFSI